MKKRNLKSFELNKKTISTFETSQIQGGSGTTSLGCTLGDICHDVIAATFEVVDYLNDLFD